MAVKDTRRPISQLNFDTEDRLLPATHYRYAKNGRSGTSDRDGEGSVENIRGNVLRNPAFAARGQVVGSCSDVRNNAIIDFIAGKTYSLTYVGASVSSTTPLVVGIAGIAAPNTVLVGDVLIVTQGLTSFTGRVTNITIGLYTMTLLSGTPNTNAITAISVSTNNYIRRWYPATNTFENLTNPVLMSAVLGFSVSKRIYNAKVIESSFGQLLTWVEYPDGIPCLMNIDKMKIGGAYYSTAADNQYIRLAKQPPFKQPDLEYENEIGNVNYLDGKYYQFRYRYVYDDNQPSVFSPVSKITNTDKPYSKIKVSINSGHKTVKYIEVCVKISDPALTTESPVWYRFIQIDKIEKGWSDNTLYDVDFFGSEQLITIASIDTDKNFESIPVYSNAIEVVNESQIVLANNTEGYDNLNVDCDFELTYEPTRIISFSPNLNAYSSCPFRENDTLYVRTSAASPTTAKDSYLKIKASDVSGYPDTFGNRLTQVLADMGSTYTYNATTNQLVYVSGDTLRQITTIPSEIKTGSETTTNAQASTGGIEATIFTTQSASEYEHFCEVYLNFTAKMNTTNQNVTFRFYVNNVLQSTVSWPVTTVFTNYSFERLVNINTGDTLKITVQASSLLNALVIQAGAVYGMRTEFSLTAQKGFKYDSTVTIGVVYYDEYLRSTTVQKVTEIKIPALGLTENKMYSTQTPLTGFLPAISWEMKSLPPIWAKYYQFVYKGTTVSEFAYMLLKSSTVLPNGLVEIEYEGDYNYLPEIGDICRYVLFQNTGNYQTITSEVNTNSNYSDVVNVDVANKKITVKALGTNYTFLPADPSQTVFEIRRKKPEINPVFFEFSEFYEIGNAGTATRFHKGETQDQNPASPSAIPATGTINNGDIYFRFYRELAADWTYFKGNYVYKESLYPTEGVNTHFWDKGRVNIQSPYSKQVNLVTGLRWSGKIANETLVNNLSTWDEGNYNVQINPRFGAITGLRQIGYTLKIIQWANYNTAFIGRREVQNADGSTQLVVTDNLIGTINPSEMEFGTKYPGSIINTGRRVYFFDSLKSKYIVDDGNGLNEIAMYPSGTGAPTTTMTKYWRQIAETINGDSNYEIITGFDYLFRDMYVTILNRAANTQETLYYNEMQNAWKYFMDMEHLNAAGNVKYIPDFYGNVGQVFVANMMTNLFEFNQAESGGQPVYGQLFKINSNDPVKPLVVETIGMIEPDKVKVFLNHSVHANLRPTLVEIRVPANEMYPNGMYTVLKPANYAYREGVFYADIKRDAYTKGFTTNPDQLRQNIAGGRPMRGHVCLVRLTFDYSDYTKLFTTAIGMIPSELS